MKLTVDRITENFAVLEKEDLTHIEVECNLLPEGIKEGTVLVFDGSCYCIDAKAEADARNRIINKQRSIFKKH